jgi:hypothetical protein
VHVSWLIGNLWLEKLFEGKTNYRHHSPKIQGSWVWTYLWYFLFEVELAAPLMPAITRFCGFGVRLLCRENEQYGAKLGSIGSKSRREKLGR